MASRVSHQNDDGSVLPLVLVIIVVLGAVVTGVITYGTANLRYGRVTERRSEQLAAADAALSYAVNLIRIERADCLYNDNTVDLPAIVETFNGAVGSVTCTQTGGGLDNAGLFAIVLTGERLADSDYLVETQGGDAKRIGGPLFMQRVDADAFELANDKGLLIEAAPLLHYDDSDPCDPISESLLDPDVVFEPDTIFGPICTDTVWNEYGPSGETFDEPPIEADLAPSSTLNPDGMTVRDGQVAVGGTVTWSPATRPVAADPADLVTIQGAYTDTPGCRVFEPGRYLRPPKIGLNQQVYFKSGDYLFDFRSPTSTGSTLAALGAASVAGSEFSINKATVIAGKWDPSSNLPPVVTGSSCATAMANDLGGYGATFYMSRDAQLVLDEQSIIEINPRLKGDLRVAIHAICDGLDEWCDRDHAGVAPSTRFAPTTTSNPALIWIKAGQTSQIIANGLIWAPEAELYFKNVANHAEVRFRGGMIVSRATVHAAASAQGFEIGVGSQDIEVDLRLIATGTDVDGGTTQIAAAVTLDYTDEDLDTRVSVDSWRVCEALTC